MKYQEALASRDNNYNGLRLLAAMMVMFSHAFTVVTGHANEEPMRMALGITPGSIAVDAFFIISGALITGSMHRCDSVRDFIVARFLRVFPGLACSLLVLIPVACLINAGSVDLQSAFDYAVGNLLPRDQSPMEIHGVFTGNPAGAGFNASLWTLPVELRMYRNVLLLWIASFIFFSKRKLAFKALVIAAAAWFSFKHFGIDEYSSIEEAAFRLPYMFFIGAAAFAGAQWIQLRPRYFSAAVTIVVLTAAIDQRLFFLAYSVLLGYVILFVAHTSMFSQKRGLFPGDYSYGIYIYAWPVQQMAIALKPNLDVAEHLALTAPLVLLISAISWHFIEGPALRLKGKLLPKDRRLTSS